MNVKNAIAALKPLKGHHILILTDAQPHGFVHSQPCLRVQDLPPDQRQSGQGNVVLWNGRFTPEGLQAGSTFWAKDVRAITWGYDHIVAHLHTNIGTRISIIKQWRLDKQGEDQ